MDNSDPAIHTVQMSHSNQSIRENRVEFNP